MLFLPNVPGDWNGVVVGEPVRAATGLPTVLINDDARAFGLAELRLGAGRGASTMVGLTLGTGVGGCICIDGRLFIGHLDTGGELGHTTDRARRPLVQLRQPRLHRVVRQGGGGGPPVRRTRPRKRPWRARRLVTRQRSRNSRRSGGIWASRFSKLIIALTPDCVVLGGGVAAAGDLLLGPIKAEVRRRVRVTDLDRIRFTIAELGTWAGAIGAAVHGAEQAEAAFAGR